MKDKVSAAKEHIVEYTYIAEVLAIFSMLAGSLVTYAVYMRGLQ